MNEGITPYTPVKLLFDGVRIDKLRTINLVSNGIETNGDRCIPDFLSTNPPLKRIYLDKNRLTDDDAILIGLALQSNTNLRYLGLKLNALTVKGKSAVYFLAVIGRSLSDPSDLESFRKPTLGAVSGANHTCEIHGLFCGSNITNVDEESENWGKKVFMNNSNKSAKWNRGGKLFWLLAAMHRKGCSIPNIESELPERNMGFVPHVLACINTYSAYWRRSDFCRSFSSWFETGKRQRCTSSTKLARIQSAIRAVHFGCRVCRNIK